MSFFSYLRGLTSEEGTDSSTRFVMLVLTGLFVLTVIAWMVMSVIHSCVNPTEIGFIEFPIKTAGVEVGAIAIAKIFKAIQYPNEPANNQQ